MRDFRSLDDYATRRIRMSGGGFIDPQAIDDSLSALKQIYLQPMDALSNLLASDRRNLVNFANYDYLGLGQDGRVRQAAASACLESGVGAGASRLVGGNLTIHDRLEQEIAEFLRVDDSLSLVSGYLTNASLIGHLLTKNDNIFIDELSHNSMVVGAEMSRAQVHRFAHNDLGDLEAKLRSHRESGARALIVVEGLYSMDGDIPDLPGLLALRDRYDAWILIDEAHSIGILGPTGRGIAEHFGVDAREIDFIIGTFSKTFSASGGFIAGRKRVIEWLRFTLPGFVFSVGLSPAVVAAVRTGLSVLETEPWRVSTTRANAQLFLREAHARGLDTGESIGAAVVSLIFPTHQMCMVAAQRLLQAGYFAPPIPKLAVPKERPRIRFFITALHTESELVAALDIVASVTEADTPPPEAIFAETGSPEAALSD